MVRGELIGVDAAQRMAEDDDRAEAETVEDGEGVRDVAPAAVVARAVRLPVPPLVGRDRPASSGASSRASRAKVAPLREVAVQGQQGPAGPAEVEEGQPAPVEVQIDAGRLGHGEGHAGTLVGGSDTARSTRVPSATSRASRHSGRCGRSAPRVVSLPWPG